jgi:deazaflavin-dependent oxidoreductase (nitroreductase family)
MTPAAGPQWMRQRRSLAVRLINRTVNRLEAALVRRTGRSAFAFAYRTPVLVLETAGRRSGQVRSTPVAYRPAGDGTWLIVGGAAGIRRTPDWVANLRAEPRAGVVIDRRRIAVTARELTGDERSATWEELTAVWPRIERYQQRSGRIVAVFALTPVEAPPGGS